MQTLRIAGEWLVTEPSEITVADFVSWRKTKGGRKFDPFAVLKAGAHTIVLDGYEDVWGFLDVIQPGMYRSSVNAAMSGRIEGVVYFADELQILIEESAAENLLFSYVRRDVVQIPNDVHVLEDAYVSTSVCECTSETQLFANLPHYVATLDLPLRGRDDAKRFPFAVIGEHPQYVLASEVWIQTLCYNPHGRDVRPFRMTPNKGEDMVRDLTFRLSERTYAGTGDNRDSPGMWTMERDRLEHDWAVILPTV
jgi:hypothetical protein